MTKSYPHDQPADYCGKILTGNYSHDLLQELKKQISAYLSFEQIDIPIMPYIAAWHTDKKGMWYEYVGNRFLKILDTDPEHIAAKFCDAIIDRREYNEQNDIFPDIKESTINRKEINNYRDRLREKVVQTGIVEAVYKISVPDNKEIWLKDWAAVTSWPGDSICLSSGYLTDISKEMSQKDQIDELNTVVNRDKELLVETERRNTLGQVSAQVFHEIRNPIVSIGGLAKRLIKNSTSTAPRIYMEIIIKEAERLEKVLNNLFHYTNQVDLRLQKIDPIQLVKSVVGLIRSYLDTFHINVSFKTSGEIPIIQADRDQLQMALVHIINNSVEAMSDGGELGITIEHADNYLLFSICDNGIGIRPVHRKKVMEPFFSTKTFGTGMGLSIAEKAIRLHNGTLTIKQLQSGGTEAVFILPTTKELTCRNNNNGQEGTSPLPRQTSRILSGDALTPRTHPSS